MHSGQTVNSTGVTGYTATLAAGNFATGDGTLTYTITGTASTSGIAYFALNISGSSCNLDLAVRSCSAKVNATDTKIFHCYNLGAHNTRADPFTPGWELNGNYYQWGSNPACFGTDGIDAVNPCTSPVYGAAGPWGKNDVQDNADAIAGWSNTNPADTLWRNAPNPKGIQDPCPTGFRIPSKAQWQAVINPANNPQSNPDESSWTALTTNYSAGKNFGNNLFLPAAGYRDIYGELNSRGSGGSYWSSSVSFALAASSLYFSSGSASTSDGLSRRVGNSLRCIAAD